MAEAKKDDVQAAPAAAMSAGGGGNKLVMILTLVNLLVTMAMVGILYISFRKESHQAKVEDIVTHEAGGGGGKAEGGGGHGGGAAAPVDKKKALRGFGKIVALDQFTVNLATPGTTNPKFVRVNVSLEVPGEEAEAEVGLKMPQIRNTVIDLFNSKRVSDLQTPEGRDYVKEEIRNALNGFMVTGKVKGVFFTSFALSN